MKSSLDHMDLEEWELVPDEGFLEINDDGGKKIYSRKFSKSSNTSSSVFQMNYFIPLPKSTTPEFVQEKMPNQLLHIPQDQELDNKEAAKTPIEIKITPPAQESIKIESFNTDPDPVSQVSFKKMKETEFVDMKVESPKFGSSRAIMNQTEGGAGVFHFGENGEPKADSKMVIEKNMGKDLDENDEGGLNIWKWGLTRIGAICSFGVAAATLCFIIYSSQRKNKHMKENQKLQFQIYTNDNKKINQVIHRASKIQEAISAARGVAITRAHITFGGYYDAPL